MKNIKIELTDNLIGIQGLGTYHGYFNPDYILNNDLMDQDFDEGLIKFNPDQYWSSLFSWYLYTDNLKGLIDNELHWLTDYFNELLDDSIIQIDCVGIDSPKYYNFVEHCLQNNEIYYWDCIKEGSEVWD